MKSNILNAFRKSSCDRISQGDILKNFTLLNYTKINNEWDIQEVSYPYAVIMSQDCDLDGDYKKRIELAENNDLNEEKLRSCYNKVLPFLLLCPAFPAALLKEGIHISDDCLLNKFNSKSWKIVKHNDNFRYHYLEGKTLDDGTQIPNLVIDFKFYLSVPRNFLYDDYKNLYFVSLNELFREDLSFRFFNFQSRIGLPVF